MFWGVKRVFSVVVEWIRFPPSFHATCDLHFGGLEEKLASQEVEVEAPEAC